MNTSINLPMMFGFVSPLSLISFATFLPFSFLSPCHLVISLVW